MIWVLEVGLVNIRRTLGDSSAKTTNPEHPQYPWSKTTSETQHYGDRGGRTSAEALAILDNL